MIAEYGGNEYMFQHKAEWVYMTMVGHIEEAYRLPGVEDAFAEGSYCMERYCTAMDAYERLRNRMGVVDEDNDVEIIIRAFEDIQQELCYRMYRYGVVFGE